MTSRIENQLPIPKFPYFEFAEDFYEGRYFNSNGYAVAVVAHIRVERAWSAYMGGASDRVSEEEALAFVAAHGAKLSEKDARHFFPLIDLPYAP